MTVRCENTDCLFRYPDLEICRLDEISLDDIGNCTNCALPGIALGAFLGKITAPKMKIKLDDGAYMPERAHDTDAGYDLRTPYRVVLHPNSNAVVRTGVHIQLPPGKCAVVISKSGLYVNHNISSTGLIDEGYTGEIVVNLLNHSGKIHIFEPGDKISQFFITDYYRYELEETDELDLSDRGDDGIGSTGR